MSQWGRLSASRIDASRLCRIAFTFRFCIACSKLWRPPASPAAHRPLGGGASRVLFGVAATVALGVFFGFRYFVNALNCVSYGEPDVRPAGRPDGRVRGLARRVGGIHCGSFRAGYTGHWPVRGRARPYTLRRRYSLRFISRRLYRPRRP